MKTLARWPHSFQPAARLPPIPVGRRGSRTGQEIPSLHEETLVAGDGDGSRARDSSPPSFGLIRSSSAGSLAASSKSARLTTRVRARAVPAIRFAKPGRGFLRARIPRSQGEHAPTERRARPNVSKRLTQVVDPAAAFGRILAMRRQRQERQPGRPRLSTQVAAKHGRIPIVPAAGLERSVQNEVNSGLARAHERAAPRGKAPASRAPSAQPRNACSQPTASRAPSGRGRSPSRSARRGAGSAPADEAATPGPGFEVPHSRASALHKRMAYGVVQPGVSISATTGSDPSERWIAAIHSAVTRAPARSLAAESRFPEASESQGREHRRLDARRSSLLVAPVALAASQRLANRIEPRSVQSAITRSTSFPFSRNKHRPHAVAKLQRRPSSRFLTPVPCDLDFQ